MKNIGKKDLFFVGIQFLLFGLYLFPLIQYPFSIHVIVEYLFLLIALLGVLAIIFAILQLNTNLTAFPTPKNDSELVQEGLFKYVRHPIYSGIILTTIGWGFFQESVWQMGIGITLWVLFYFKSQYEESLLESRYADYKNYKKVSGRFFPFL